jgi:hypothetical protein
MELGILIRINRRTSIKRTHLSINLGRRWAILRVSIITSRKKENSEHFMLRVRKGRNIKNYLHTIRCREVVM